MLLLLLLLSHFSHVRLSATLWTVDYQAPLVVFPGGSDGKASIYNAGDLGSIPGSGRFPGEGNGNPLYYCCLKKSHGRRSLANYSVWGHKELDTTEQLSHTFNIEWFG